MKISLAISSGFFYIRKSLLNHVLYFPEIAFCFWKHLDDGLLANYY